MQDSAYTGENDIADPVARETLLAGLGLGVSGNYLLWAGLQGPGLLLWTTLFAGAALLLARHASKSWQRIIVLWSGTALAAALMLTLRASEVLIPLMLLLVVLSAAVTLMQARGVRLQDARVVDYFLAGLNVPRQAFAGAIPVIRDIDLSTDIPNPRLLGIGRGILLTIPLLIVFTSLFAMADASFNRTVSQLSNVFSAQAVVRLFWIAVVSWLVTGVLSVVRDQVPVTLRTRRQIFSLGVEEITVIMGALAALFLLFVALQISYLFGGQAIIESNTGLTVAEYARRGFLELLVASVLLILISATQRLWLYVSAFGLTLERVIAIAVMLWLAYSLLLFAATVVRIRSSWFASSLAIGGMVFSIKFSNYSQPVFFHQK